MFICSLKASNLKFIGAIILSLAALFTIILLIPDYESSALTSLSALPDINYRNIKTNDDRVAFLAQFGWTVDSTPLEECKVTIPSEFDKVFTGYNELQKRQGLDLSKYRRKEMTRYTYTVTNYPNYSGKVIANILVYRNRVVGGDICSADLNGFIHGFTASVKPD